MGSTTLKRGATCATSTSWIAEPRPESLPFAEELKRKGIHLLSLSIAIGYYVLGRALALGVLVPMAALSFLVEVMRTRSGPFRRWFEACFGSLLRPHERDLGDRKLRLTGATWLLVGAVLTVGLFSRPIGAAAIAMLILSDIAAALVGRRWGRRRLPFNPNKTVAGSAAFCATALLVALCTPGLPPLVGLVGAVAATLAEALDRPLDDNLRIPLAAGSAMTLAQSWLYG
ncbi:MAG: SEC59/DGK1/VTE5 family protein [Bacteroidetes bacterium]|nr:SEC59/DGK1/VTE5 family protein [Rhodothermia bacterium]MCS7155200.1 SEC59/DGK1/VTE5 family protein [Bacteroidota bacterium]MCX7907785.1 SEC59/DGK1/VTE5 family protein [Bacteroidota bacterium]MDW8138604.1 SEC59/DGK1/VTE5 family protein [Bacteroidota bacterium]MDW8284810.1 SEC59/DGK1/VTE5 family protein [Bacteroidota bacterium]